jgi:hypothetical protein
VIGGIFAVDKHLMADEISFHAKASGFIRALCALVGPGVSLHMISGSLLSREVKTEEEIQMRINTPEFP